MFVGGDPAVDFVNTVVVESTGPVDSLVSDARLLAWARAAGLGVPTRCVREARPDGLHAGVRPLRSALRAVLLAQASGKQVPRDELRKLNAWLAKPRVCAGLVRSPGGLRREVLACRSPADVLLRVAELGAELLCGPEVDRLKACAHERCVLLFVDRSRSRRRRWCSMKVCGNRVKAAAFQERVRGS